MDSSKKCNRKRVGLCLQGQTTKQKNFRSLWIQRIGAGARINGLSYSQFMGKTKVANIDLNRKVLADLAMNQPDAFKAIVDKVK